MGRPGRYLIGTIVLAIGIALAGFLAGNGLARARASDRFVTVKGVSEREASANLAIWPLRVVGADDDLAAANSQLQTSVAKIRSFLARHQIDTSRIQLQDFSVTDALANPYAQRGQIGTRYIINQTIVVRSTHPELVLAASQRIAELVSDGVVFSSGAEYGSRGPTFVFTGLSEIKPEMIAEATARAREAAEQFARDSRSELGGIRRADQGVFVILPRDQAAGITEESQIVKTVRVVSTIEYFLRD
ncbi:MAG: SIMPL domain-containing protein [Gemmatimonadaceae bacterium]